MTPRLPTFPSVLLADSTVLTNGTTNGERVNAPLQTCLCHLRKTGFLNAILYRKIGPLKLGPRNQIKTFKHVCVGGCLCVFVCVFIYIKKSLPYNENQPTNQTENLKVYTCFLTFTANQKLHRIYFVQGEKPLKCLDQNSSSLSVLPYQISSNLCFK